MTETLEKAPVIVEQKVSKRGLSFYRVNREWEDDKVLCGEKYVRYSLSAWFKDVEHAMKRIHRGEKVYTPYAYYCLA